MGSTRLFWTRASTSRWRRWPGAQRSPPRCGTRLASLLTEAVALAAYFVASEALANVVKHAHASAATVAVRRTRTGVEVQISDDGVGGADPSRGSGLRGLADRVDALKGNVNVFSPPDAGTVITAEFAASDMTER